MLEALSSRCIHSRSAQRGAHNHWGGNIDGEGCVDDRDRCSREKALDSRWHASAR